MLEDQRVGGRVAGRNSVRAVRLVIAAVLLLPNTSWGTTVYRYEGNFFDQIFDGDPPTGSTFTTADRVTGFFEVASPLGPSMAVTDISGLILSFLFDAGPGAVAPTTGGTIISFLVATDSQGNISTWSIEVQDFDEYTQIGDQGLTIRSSTSPADVQTNDGASLLECLEVACLPLGPSNFAVDIGQNFVTPGTWSQALPVPSLAPWGGVLLAGLLLGATLFVVRRRPAGNA